MCHDIMRDERGFTMIELLVASVTMVIVLGGAVAITSQIQQGYRRQLEDSAAEQEARYALDWIGKLHPRRRQQSVCRSDYQLPREQYQRRAIQFDPDLDGEDNDIRLMTDANPPDGWIGGTNGACTQAGEDVTISLDNANNTIVVPRQQHRRRRVDPDGYRHPGTWVRVSQRGARRA